MVEGRRCLVSQAALTQAKTEANAVYMPPVMQARLDLQSGLLHAAEHDHKTASAAASASGVSTDPTASSLTVTRTSTKHSRTSTRSSCPRPRAA